MNTDLRARLLGALGLSLAGCSGEPFPDTLCLEADAEASCPTIEEAEDPLLYDGCGLRTLSVDGEAERVESADTGVAGDAPVACCYPVTRVDGPDCWKMGRPYRPDGVALTAPPVARDRRWSAHGATPHVFGLTDDARATLAAAWTHDALLEHASVASFARLVLELLAVGAPADLVREAASAAADEVRHARLCFSLASAYAGAPTAPGRFPFGGAVPARADLARIAADTVREGCVGETLAAVMAAEARDGATDPAVRAALHVIARDEARHAELAWRIVMWALQEGGAAVRGAVADAFAEVGRPGVGAAGVGAAASAAAGLRAHGRLDAPTADTVATNALTEIVLPCAAAMLAAIGAPDHRFAS
ncbi:MAG: ferritin-like domain-containing protein [Pseudomonadota bacterium]|nr:ferritin-like domain-containing protein [Pseudomonadota bacterium]